jgi:diacylglycerol kinase (ATP)
VWCFYHARKEVPLMLIIIKPSDKKNHKNSVDWLLKECKKRQIEPELYLTIGNFLQDCANIALLAKSQTQVVVIGGDGTLHLAVNALMTSDCSIALIPAGTGNDFARGFARKQQAWHDAVFNSRTELIDIGQINQRYFINVAGIGFDAEVVTQLNKAGSFSSFGYTWQGIKQLFSFQARSLQGEFNGRPLSYSNLATIFANHHYFGGGLKIAPRAKLNDGQLDCYCMPADGLLKNLISFLYLLLVKHHSLKRLKYTCLTTAEVTTKGLSIEADGELVGFTPAKVKVHKQALRFHVP